MANDTLPKPTVPPSPAQQPVPGVSGAPSRPMAALAEPQTIQQLPAQQQNKTLPAAATKSSTQPPVVTASAANPAPRTSNNTSMTAQQSRPVMPASASSAPPTQQPAPAKTGAVPSPVLQNFSQSRQNQQPATQANTAPLTLSKLQPRQNPSQPTSPVPATSTTTSTNSAGTPVPAQSVSKQTVPASPQANAMGASKAVSQNPAQQATPPSPLGSRTNQPLTQSVQTPPAAPSVQPKTQTTQLPPQEISIKPPIGTVAPAGSSQQPALKPVQQQARPQTAVGNNAPSGTATPVQAPTAIRPPTSGVPTQVLASAPSVNKTQPTQTPPTQKQPSINQSTQQGTAPVVQRPPATLTAMSSMTSNQLPSQPGNMQQKPTQTPPGPVRTANVTANTNSVGGATPPPPAKPVAVKAGLSAKMVGIIGGAVAVVLLLVLGIWWFMSGGSSGSTTPVSNGNTQNSQPATPSKQVSIEYWGLWEPTEVMQQVFKDFEKQNPGVTINYRKQSAKDYRTRLENAIASENGPDLFRFHASWTSMLKDELAPMPTSVMDVNTYQKTFYPIATYQLQSNGQIVGVPLMYDGLALYYNEEIFKTADIQPPKTWSELQAAAVKLTVKQNNRIQRAGIAMGTVTNVEHFSDIVALLMLQNGAKLDKPNSPETRDALMFYVNFSKQLGVWDDTLPSSTVAFARGDAAMMLAPSWRVFEIQQANPDLKFGIAPVPQIPDSTRIAWGTYWAEGVNSKGKNKDISWALVKYMSAPEVMKKLHAEQAKTRSFGEIYARTDMAEDLASNTKIQAFLQDAPYAQSGYMNSYTHDAGVNDQTIQYYKDAINALNSGQPMEKVLETLDKGVQQVLRQYAAE